MKKYNLSKAGMSRVTCFLVFCLLAAFITKGIAQSDTLNAVTDNSIPNPDDDFEIFLMAVGTAAVCFMLGFFVLGMVIFVLLCLLVFGLISAGVISVSVVTALYTKSVANGFKTFLLVSMSICGMIAGILVLGMVSAFYHLQMTGPEILLSGGIAGVASGVLLAIAINYVFRKMMAYLAVKFKLIKQGISRRVSA